MYRQCLQQLLLVAFSFVGFCCCLINYIKVKVALWTTLLSGEATKSKDE